MVRSHRMLVVVLAWTMVCSFGVSRSGAAESAGHWSRFRGPRGNGATQATGLPLTWDEGSNVRWKTPVPGKAWSSPVVWNDQVWVTTAPEDGRQLLAVCLNAATGDTVKTVLVFENESPQFCHAFNSYASPTPAIEEGRVWVHYGSHGTACLDTATAETVWTRRDLPCDHYRGAGSSPIVHGELLYLTFDGYDLQYIVALNKHTGETVWRRDRNIDYGTDNGDQKKAYGTPTVITVEGRELLVGPSAGATIAYDPLSGDEIWRVQHGGMNVAAPPIAAGGLLFLSTGDGGFRLLAMRPDGKGDVTKSHVVWKVEEAAPSRCAPLVIDDLVYIINETGIVSCLEAATGELVWRQRLGGNFTASPLYGDDKIYFFSQEGQTHVIEPGRKFKLLAKNKLDDGFMASPAVIGHDLLLRTTTHVYQIGQ